MSRILPPHYDKLVRSVIFSPSLSLVVERLANMINTNAQRLSTDITKALLSEKRKSTIWFCISR